MILLRKFCIFRLSGMRMPVLVMGYCVVRRRGGVGFGLVWFKSEKDDDDDTKKKKTREVRRDYPWLDSTRITKWFEAGREGDESSRGSSRVSLTVSLSLPLSSFFFLFGVKCDFCFQNDGCLFFRGCCIAYLWPVISILKLLLLLLFRVVVERREMSMKIRRHCSCSNSVTLMWLLLGWILLVVMASRLARRLPTRWTMFSPPSYSFYLPFSSIASDKFLFQ